MRTVLLPVSATRKMDVAVAISKRAEMCRLPSIRR